MHYRWFLKYTKLHLILKLNDPFGFSLEGVLDSAPYPQFDQIPKARRSIVLSPLRQSQRQSYSSWYVIGQKVELLVKLSRKSPGQQSHQQNAALTT